MFPTFIHGFQNENTANMAANLKAFQIFLSLYRKIYFTLLIFTITFFLEKCFKWDMCLPYKCRNFHHPESFLIWLFTVWNRNFDTYTKFYFSNLSWSQSLLASAGVKVRHENWQKKYPDCSASSPDEHVGTLSLLASKCCLRPTLSLSCSVTIFCCCSFLLHGTLWLFSL